MKKLFLMMMASLLMLSLPVEAQNKQLEKARKKEYKQKKKEFEKNGWKIFGSTRSIDVALLKHYEALDKAGESAYELPGGASSF